MSFYVVWEGKEKGIFTTWGECKNSVEGFKGAKYKKFNAREEAEEAYYSVEEAKNKVGGFKIKAVFADGGVCGRNPSIIGGTIGWVAVTDGGSPAYTNGIELGGIGNKDLLVKSHSEFIPFENLPVTNNHTEMLALISALEAMEDGWSGYAVSDSKITLGRIFENWKCENLPLDYIRRFVEVKNRLGILVPIHIDGHATKLQLATGIGKRGNSVSKWNVMCDYLCNEAKKI